MSTTTEILDATCVLRAQPWSRTLAIGGAALAGWLAILVGVTALAEPHPDVLVPGPPRHTLALLHGTDIRVSDLRETHAVLRGTTPGFVRMLYARGALLVLPVRAPGCMPAAR